MWKGYSTRRLEQRPKSYSTLERNSFSRGFWGFCADVTAASTIEEALALSHVEGDEVLVICGSFFLASEIRDAAIAYYTK